MNGESRIGLDPALGALRISAMIRAGETTLEALLSPPLPPIPAPCSSCGCTCKEVSR